MEMPWTMNKGSLESYVICIAVAMAALLTTESTFENVCKLQQRNKAEDILITYAAHKESHRYIKQGK